MKFILLCVGLFIFFACKQSGLGNLADVRPIGIVLAAGGLNMRAEPSTDAEILVTIPQYTHLKLLGAQKAITQVGDKSGIWTKAEYQSRTGWVFDATGFLAKTKAYEDTLFVVNEDGVSLRSIPNPNGQIIADLPYGTEIHTLTEGFQTGNVPTWTYVLTSKGKGYVLDRQLSIIAYAPEKFASGPFVGMRFTGLPAAFRTGSWTVLNSHDQMPKDGTYSIGFLNHKDKSSVVFYKQIGLRGLHAEHEIRQIVETGSIAPKSELVLGGPNVVGLRCRDQKGSFPLAIADRSLGRREVDKSGNATCQGILKIVWLFDPATETLKPTPPPEGNTCWEINPSSFD